MTRKKVLLLAISALTVFSILFLPLIIFYPQKSVPISTSESVTEEEVDKGEFLEPLHPLSIEYMRQQEYPGSEITIEQELPDGSNYKRYIASHLSEGLKIYGLLTVPEGESPEKGWPVIIFNHGYISPDVYRTTEKYVAYTDAFSRNGYIVFKSDYRGHGNSEGQARGGYGNNDYTIDVLNAVASFKKYPSADAENIGIWGHSMGGYISLRAMVIDPDIKAGVIWAGVVGPYPDPFLRGRGSELNPNATPRPTRSGRGRWRTELIAQYGTYEQNPVFWNSISATGFLQDLSGPIQLHHGTADSSVPVEASEYLAPLLEAIGKSGGLYTYPGDDHNISANFSTAMKRSAEFFDENLK